jgi:hypothetical protein
MTGPSVKPDADSRLTPHRLDGTWFQINKSEGGDGRRPWASDALWFRGSHLFGRDLQGRKQGILTAGRRATNSMLYSVLGNMGACIMDAYLIVALICSVYLAGRIATHRGRSFKVWAWIAAFIGPLALPLIFLFPNLHRKNGDLA